MLVPSNADIHVVEYAMERTATLGPLICWYNQIWTFTTMCKVRRTIFHLVHRSFAHMLVPPDLNSRIDVHTVD